MLDIDNRYDMLGLAGKSAVNETVRDSKGLTCVGSLYFRYKLLILFCGHEGRVRSVREHSCQFAFGVRLPLGPFTRTAITGGFCVGVLNFEFKFQLSHFKT